MTYLKKYFSLDPAALLHACCTFLIACLTYTYLFYQPSSQAAWLILSSLLLSQAGLSAELSFQAAWNLLYYPLCALILATFVLLFSLISPWFIYTAALLALVVGISTYLAFRTPSFFFAAFTLSLLSILAFFMPSSLESAVQRFYLILLGGFLVFSIRFIFFLYRRRYALYYAKIQFFQKLKKLYQLIFYTSEERKFLFRSEWEESHFQLAWRACLTALQYFKTQVSPAYCSSLDRIWDLTLSLGSLRYRLSDYTVLTMSQDEISALLAAIFSILNEFLSSKPSSIFSSTFEGFQGAIQDFEALYRSMLQTTAKEPLVLLLFIQDLYALKEEFEKMARGDPKPC